MNKKAKFSNNLKPKELLIDKGFSSEFQYEHVRDLYKIFSDDEKIYEQIHEIRDFENSIDIKRGELYPELLRAVFSLKRAVSSIYDVDLIQVQPNFGSNGSIDTILTAVKIREVERMLKHISKKKNYDAMSENKSFNLRNEGRGVMFATPTYFRNYNSASARDLNIHKVPLREDFNFDSKHFISEMLDVKPSIVMLVSPNNPSGMPISDADLLSVLGSLPKDTWAMIDRTLVNIKSEISTKELLKRYSTKNIVVLHSFSKYKGMSHLRIGFALYSNSIMAKKVQPLLPIGTGLEATLKAYKFMKEEGGIFPSQKVLSNIKENCNKLKKFVQENPQYQISDSSSNYCVMVLPKTLNSQNVCRELDKIGLFVMGGHEFPEPNNKVVRLFIGGKPQYIRNMCEMLARK